MYIIYRKYQLIETSSFLFDNNKVSIFKYIMKKKMLFIDVACSDCLNFYVHDEYEQDVNPNVGF